MGQLHNRQGGLHTHAHTFACLPRKLTAVPRVKAGAQVSVGHDVPVVIAPRCSGHTDWTSGILQDPGSLIRRVIVVGP